MPKQLSDKESPPLNEVEPVQVNNFPSKLRQLPDSKRFWKGMALILFAVFTLNQIFIIDIGLNPKLARIVSLEALNDEVNRTSSSPLAVDLSSLQNVVIPQEGVALPITWKDLGKRMIADGVIDEQKFRALFEGGLTAEEEAMLTGNYDKPVVLTLENSRYVLNMLWAFGLANKNDILENGEMTDPEISGGDAGRFASTGGWTLSRGSSMDHYSNHGYVRLNDEQQALVVRVSKGIFRPCCGNSTHFPDCNHGMAMLGLLQLMAANGVSEKEMYEVALRVNSYWFPQTYIDLATYFEEQGVSWNEVNPQVVLGSQYSSAQGYQSTKQSIQSLPQPQQGGGGCGV
jgi:hypothetical protein